MSIIATAPVPGNGNLRSLDTDEYPTFASCTCGKRLDIRPRWGASDPNEAGSWQWLHADGSHPGDHTPRPAHSTDEELLAAVDPQTRALAERISERLNRLAELERRVADLDQELNERDETWEAGWVSGAARTANAIALDRIRRVEDRLDDVDTVAEALGRARATGEPGPESPATGGSSGPTLAGRVEELESQVADLVTVAKVFATNEPDSTLAGRVAAVEEKLEQLATAESIVGRATTGSAPVWPPKSCPSWCMYVDDPESHAYDGQHDVDCTHLHDHARCGQAADPDLPSSVPLSREWEWAYGGPERPTWEKQCVSVEMSQHYRQAEPILRVNHVAGVRAGSCYDMTLAEAEQLAQLLLHLVELGRRG